MGKARSLSVLLALLVAACHVAHADVYEDLEKWVIENGGSMKTKIGFRKDGVRGLFMKEEASEGDHVATIPSSVMINAGSLDSSIMAGTLIVLRELLDPHSRFNPYKATWPKPNEVLNVCNFPRQYDAMIHPYWIRQMNISQDYLQSALKGELNQDLEYTIKETVGNANITYEDLQYACAISTTRFVTEGKRRRLMMIPIFDMENHVRQCPHTTTELGGGTNVSIVLGEDVEAGDELCYSYTENMRDDYAVFNYGFLPDLEDPPRLLEVDHHDFNMNMEHNKLSDEPFDADNEKAFQAEIARLEKVLIEIADQEKQWPPAPPADSKDYVYELLIELHDRRKDAIQHEIKRLKEVMAEIGDDVYE